MTRKPRGKDFKNSPFKTLKGLSVPRQAEPKTDPAPPPVQSTEADEDFSSAMDFLGVSRISADETDMSPPLDGVDSAQLEEKTPPLPSTEEDEFLAALGQFDVRFEDELPDDEEPRALPRRMKQLQRGKVKIDRDLDLHGLSRAEAEAKFRHFLTDAAYQGWSTLRVITGRGLHSSTETPVLRNAIEHLLKHTSFPAVVEWGRAPRNLGGGGAIILFLREKA